MNNHFEYWYFTCGIDESWCDRVVDLGLKEIDRLKKENISTNATTGDLNLTKKENDKRVPLNDKTFGEEITNKYDETYIRDSEVSWLTDQFIYDKVFPMVKEANKKAGWNYDFDYAESCQFTKYGLNQFYGWHTDGNSDHIAAYSKDKDRNKKLYNLETTPFTEYDDFDNKVRKLSVTINLSTENSYEGGNLKFDLGPHHLKKERYLECTQIRPRGSMIVFPSFSYHQVTPVTKGTRYSLVIWFLGRPFR